MRLVEMMLTVEKQGVIRIPENELEKMDIREGDQICLSYLTKEDGTKKSWTKEFLMETI